MEFIRAEHARIQAKTLYGAYVEWSKANHVQHIVSSTAFGRMLPERGYDKVKSGEVYYIGLELNPDEVKSEKCWIIWSGVHRPRVLKRGRFGPRIPDRVPV